jgi:hypothetical protein
VAPRSDRACSPHCSPRFNHFDVLRSNRALCLPSTRPAIHLTTLLVSLPCHLRHNLSAYQLRDPRLIPRRNLRCFPLLILAPHLLFPRPVHQLSLLLNNLQQCHLGSHPRYHQPFHPCTLLVNPLEPRPLNLLEFLHRNLLLSPHEFHPHNLLDSLVEAPRDSRAGGRHDSLLYHHHDNRPLHQRINPAPFQLQIPTLVHHYCLPAVRQLFPLLGQLQCPLDSLPINHHRNHRYRLLRQAKSPLPNLPSSPQLHHPGFPVGSPQRFHLGQHAYRPMLQH